MGEGLAEPGTRRRSPLGETERFIVDVLAQNADALMRTAERNSLCRDDANDAYQRAMEVFTRRADRLDRRGVVPWLHTVIRHEAFAVRSARRDVGSRCVGADEDRIDLEASPPEDRVISTDRTARATEALKQLKADELRAIWLRALGLSYEEIRTETGWTRTKINRCLAEGRTRFLDHYSGIETGAVCRRWAPVLSAMVDGEASSKEVLAVRPHLRNCPSCRATLRELTRAERSIGVVIPLGIVGVAAKAAGLADRVLPVVANSDATVAAGGAGSLAIVIAKVTGVVAVATTSLVVATHEGARPEGRPQRQAPVTQPTMAASPSAQPAAVPARVPATTTAARSKRPLRTTRQGPPVHPGGGEFVPPQTATVAPAARSQPTRAAQPPSRAAHEFTP